MFRSILFATVMAAVASLSLAQPIDASFTYQGQLQDAGINANGIYDINFALFASQLGGVALATNLVEDVQVTDGLFTAEVDLGPDAFTPGQQRWLVIQVRPDGAGGPFQSLAPRQEITAAPFSVFATEAASADFALTSGTTLQDAYDNGNDIILDGAGSANGLRVIGNDSANRISIGFFSSLNSVGIVAAQPPSGADAWFIASDVTDGSNFLKVANNTNGNDGLRYEGKDSESQLTLAGITSAVQFDTDEAIPNNRAVLPNDSIGSLELLEEAGISATRNTPAIFLTPQTTITDVVDSRTITAPDFGAVVVIATAEVLIGKTTNDTITAEFGISDNTSTIAIGRGQELSLPSALPSGLYRQPLTIHGVFSVSPGPNTFYLLGDQTGSAGNITLSNRQITCVFLPTLYGGIFSAEENPTESQRTTPMTAAEIAAERAAAISYDESRITRELETMKEQIKQIEASLKDRR